MSKQKPKKNDDIMKSLPIKTREDILNRVIASTPFAGSDEGWKSQHGAGWRREKKSYLGKLKRWRKRFLRRHSSPVKE